LPIKTDGVYKAFIKRLQEFRCE